MNLTNTENSEEIPKPRCPYCNREIVNTYDQTIWKEHKQEKMSFCSFICAENYQMSCEG